MEVEVKLRIPDLANFTRLKNLLSSFHLKTLSQKNYFFDSPNSALSSRRAVLRLRLVSAATSTLCFLTLKANHKLVNGVSRVEEDEEEIDPEKGRMCLVDPARLRSIGSRVVKRCEEEFGVKGEMGFVCLGGFENIREVYGWRDGLKLEVDETRFDFGVCYEVECESDDPEQVKGELEGLFKENGIEFRDSEKSKFAIFRSGKLPM